MITSNFEKVIEKLRIHLKEKYTKNIYDVDIARALNISKEHFSRCKKLNKLPLEPILKFCAKENIVINYILFDQIPDSLNSVTDNIISIKYFRNINSSAGGGAINYEEEYEKLYINEETVELIGGIKNLKNIEAINVIGDSMEGTLMNNSIILVDKSKKYIEDYEIYVINTNQGIFVKRLKDNESYITLISDNKIYKDEPIYKEDITILGKVVGVKVAE